MTLALQTVREVRLKTGLLPAVCSISSMTRFLPDSGRRFSTATMRLVKPSCGPSFRFTGAQAASIAAQHAAHVRRSKGLELMASVSDPVQGFRGWWD